MTPEELVQGSQDWLLARCGSLGASEAPDVVRRTKSGYSASRAAMEATKILERLTGRPAEHYRSAAMIQGSLREPLGRAAYAFLTDREVETVGLVPHPRIAWSHASPDGLIGKEGLVQIKCPQPPAHLEHLLTGQIGRDYLVQMAWEMACTGRQYCDYVSFNPDFPVSMQLFIKRVSRDEMLIESLEEEIEIFLAEVERKLGLLTESCVWREAA